MENNKKTREKMGAEITNQEAPSDLPNNNRRPAFLLPFEVMKIWGIDPGKIGHLVSYDPEFKAFHCHPIAWELKDLVDQVAFHIQPGDLVWVEKIRIHGTGTGHIEKLVRHHERILAALHFQGVPYQEVTPIGWQDRLQLKTNRGDKASNKKQRYQKFAQYRAKKSDITQAQAEAYCICIFGIAKWLEHQSTKG